MNSLYVACESSSRVLDDDEEEEEKEEAMTEEEKGRPTGISESDVEEEEEEDESLPLVRCTVKLFLKEMKALGAERLKWLEDNPFFKLLEMSGNMQNNKAINKLVSMFNTKDRSLLLPNGSRCVVTPQDFPSI
nr:hypothetical protein [Tanacetum cinerariifolium]